MTNEELTTGLGHIAHTMERNGHSYYQHIAENAIKALEQQPSEDTEVIKVSKGAVKARQGRFVIYDVDWLKEHFYSTEEKIYGQPKQPCEDCISRKMAVKAVAEALKNTFVEYEDIAKKIIGKLPPVTPKGVTVTDFADKCKECGKIQNGLSKDAVKKIRKAIDEMTEIHSDGEFYIKNVDAKWIISKYLCGAEMSGGGEDGDSN